MEIEDVRTLNLTTLVKKYSMPKFLALTGKNPSLVSQWINRTVNSRTKKPTSISSGSCRSIESSLGLSRGWMDALHHTEQAKECGLPSEQAVPMYEWMAWDEIDQIHNMHPINFIYCPAEDYSDQTYALIMRDDSMLDHTGQNSFNKGDIIFIDPEEAPQEGDFVMTTSSHYKLASIKQLLTQDGRACLRTLNPTWQKEYILVDDTVRLHGVVIAQIKLRDKL